MRNDVFHRRWHQDIVGIEEQHHVARSCAISNLERCDVALIGLKYRANSVTVAGNDLTGTIDRAVVDDNDFIRRMRLIQRAVDCRSDVVFVVVDGYDDADLQRVSLTKIEGATGGYQSMS